MTMPESRHASPKSNVCSFADFIARKREALEVETLDRILEFKKSIEEGGQQGDKVILIADVGTPKGRKIAGHFFQAWWEIRGIDKGGEHARGIVRREQMQELLYALEDSVALELAFMVGTVVVRADAGGIFVFKA